MNTLFPALVLSAGLVSPVAASPVRPVVASLVPSANLYPVLLRPLDASPAPVPAADATPTPPVYDTLLPGTLAVVGDNVVRGAGVLLAGAVLLGFFAFVWYRVSAVARG